MKPLRKKLMLLIAIIGLSVSLSSCSDLCESTADYSVPSPDGKQTAHVYQLSCGATTEFATHISLLASDVEIGGNAGNQFTATAGEADLTAMNTIKTEVIWKDQNQLLIRYDAKAKVLEQVDQLNGVSVQYETF